MVWGAVDTFLREACESAEKRVGELREGLALVEADQDSGTMDVRSGRQRVEEARQTEAMAKWDRLSLLCARVPALLQNGTVRGGNMRNNWVRSVNGTLRKLG